MNLNVLEPFSREIARHLMAARPNWGCHLEPEGEAEATVCLTISGPRGTLLAYTEDHEITISFGDWHEHLLPNPGTPVAHLVAEAVTVIEDILTERAVVITKHAQSGWWTSELVAPPGPPDVEHLVMMTVRSWRGTHDRVVDTRTTR